MSQTARNSDPALLHPVFRGKVEELLKQLAAEAIPFALFEGFRSSARNFSMLKGEPDPAPSSQRPDPGPPFISMDLRRTSSLLLNAEWSWDTSGIKARWWERLPEIGRELGLEALPFEMPHLQLAGLKIEDLAAGRYPPGGDLTWKANLNRALASKQAA
jgi:peptidoglycan L-alanyl-D-glutamate endopeptidase CwlK